jgi:hypothetical protein
MDEDYYNNDSYFDESNDFMSGDDYGIF